MRLFHESSEYIKNWMTLQPHVKEESLTDWLLFQISQKNSSIYYKAFSRHEESQNGADWEWWVLTSDSSEKAYSGKFNAYRFVVQAKKLSDDQRDNYPSLSYANKNGLQIDLLLQNAKELNAFPLYMYYSTSEPKIEDQIDNLNYITEQMLKWCSTCQNGCFLSSAYDVYNLLFSSGRVCLDDISLLNYSYKLSLLDILFDVQFLNFNAKCEHILSRFNQKVICFLTKEGKGEKMFNQNVYGIKHYGNGIPSYLIQFVEQHNETSSWFESEMKRDLPNVDGIGVIDLRECQ